MTKPASLVHGVPDTSSSKGDPNDAPPLQPGVQPKQPAREDNDDISTAAEVADADDVVELDLADDTKTQPEPAPARRTIRGRINWKRVLAYGVLPGLVLIIGGAVGYLTYQDRSAHASQLARSQS